jgi:phosphoribosylformimino-5-aminoimidazole carboxamide ribotide isomerase
VALAQLGFGEIYVADIDAIEGAEPAWGTFRQLAQCNLALWLDAGLSDLDRARRVLAFSQDSAHITGVIAGLESLPRAGLLPQMLDLIGPDQLVLSLDLKHGRPVTVAPEWQGMEAEQIARLAFGFGLQRMIVLDLARVGVGRGTGTLALCRRLRSLSRSCQLATGGGTQHLDDFRAMARAGCDAALVATALHRGLLAHGDIQAVRRM